MPRRRPFVSHPVHPLTGKQFRVSARTERELASRLQYVDTLRNELRLGVRTAVDVDRTLRRMQHGPLPVEKAALAYIEHGGVSENTVRRVRSFLASVGESLKAVEIDNLDAPRLESWIRDLSKRGLESSSVTTAWRTLRAIVRYAISRGWVGGCPWGGWRPRAGPSNKREREALRNVDELTRLLDAAAALDIETESDGKLGDLEAKIAAAVFAGLRQGELAGLRWPDIAPPRIFIGRQYEGDPTKTGNRGHLVVASELFEILFRYRTRLQAHELYAADGPVFPYPRTSRRGLPKPYERRGEVLTRYALRKAVTAAKLPSVQAWSAQSLRDTFATLESAAHAGDLPAIAQRTRHRSEGSLVRYLRSLSREPALPGFSTTRAALDQPQEPTKNAEAELPALPPPSRTQNRNNTP